MAFVGSQAGWKGDPGASAYCASKFALEGQDQSSLRLLYPTNSKVAGVVECLQQELPMFGGAIRTLVFEPGFFRTEALSQKNLKHGPSTIPEYEKFNEMSLEFEKSIYGNEPGDPRKAVERMIDVIKGEGMAAGKTMPPRLPLGTDGLKVMRDKCQATLKLCDEWEELITSTDIAKS